MSATSFRAHFAGSHTPRPAKTNTQTSTNPTPPLAPNEVAIRQPSKLAKKSSRLPAATDSRKAKTTIAPSSTSRSTVSQIRGQVPASNASSWDLLPPPPTLRTPSLISGSSVSTFDSPRSNVLRRKPSTIGRYVDDKRAGALGIELDRSANDSRAGDYDDAVFGVSLPPRQVPVSITPLSSVNGDPLYATAGTIVTGTPSTRFTDSPFSHVPTPSSFSSISTAPLVHSAGSKLSQELSRDHAISPVEMLKQERLTVQQSATKTTSATSSNRTSRLIQPRAVSGGRTVTTQSSVKAKDSSARRPINPPELAHLSTTSPQKQSIAPPRPSRDGALSLDIASPTSPVVHSDLQPATFHKRTSSRGSVDSTSSHGFRSRFGLSPKPAPANDVPRLDTRSVDGASKSAVRGRRSSSSSSQSPVTPSVSASPVPAKPSRFAFLARKPKDESAKPVEKPKREPRKMPAAGTGHERYGRFGFGPRNGSVSPSVGTRSPSTDSVASTKSTSYLRRKSSGASEKGPELDAFLRDRLSPVVLRGSGAVSATASLKSAVESADGETSDTYGMVGLTPSVSQSSFMPAQGIIASALTMSPSSIASHSLPVSPQDQLPEKLYLAPEAAADAEGLWMKPLEEKKAPKKWNFLQRLQSSPVKLHKTPPPQHRVPFDNAAHSALMDAIEPIDLIEVEELVNENDAGPSVPPIGTGGPGSSLKGMQTKNRRTSMLPTVRKESKPVQAPLQPNSDAALAPAVHTPEMGSESPRMPRLSPIGRIPAVISRRDRERKLPDASFSRPFASSQPRPNVKPPGALYNQIRELASPVEPVTADFAADGPQDSEQVRSRSTSRGEYTMHSASGLFAFPSRKNSDFSYCSTSSDTASWMAYSRMQAMQDEDVWDEYDDLMDDSALGKPSRYHKITYAAQSPPSRDPTALQDAYFGLPPTREPSAALPRPPKPSRENSSTSVTQSTGMVHSHMHSLAKSLLRQSVISTTTIDSSRGSRASMQSRRASTGEANVRSSHTSMSSGKANRESTKHGGQHASVELKLQLLMVSKTLSFGQVLFSPAHHEMRLTNEPRVLILDGLGNDWSYFVAMTYPQATIYNLGPSGKQSGSSEGFQKLPNHRNISHGSIDATLPFPKGFFTAAVLRFPVATTDQAYHTCIAEFKRVLRPGGHLEVMVLDIDLGNVGNHVRKAVRGLKTRMQLRQENISLRSLSDFTLQLIGKRGFEEVQQCIIGVPVMQQTSATSETGSPEQSRCASKASHRVSAGRKSYANLVEEAAREPPLLESNAENTEKMTRDVARVGRWWYSQCYERSLLNTDQSIWQDQALQEECQLNNTNFRLLVCCAQKPTQLRRRTMSV